MFVEAAGLHGREPDPGTLGQGWARPLPLKQVRSCFPLRRAASGPIPWCCDCSEPGVRFCPAGSRPLDEAAAAGSGHTCTQLFHLFPAQGVPARPCARVRCRGCPCYPAGSCPSPHPSRAPKRPWRCWGPRQRGTARRRMPASHGLAASRTRVKEAPFLYETPLFALGAALPAAARQGARQLPAAECRARRCFSLLPCFPQAAGWRHSPGGSSGELRWRRPPAPSACSLNTRWGRSGGDPTRRGIPADGGKWTVPSPEPTLPQPSVGSGSLPPISVSIPRVFLSVSSSVLLAAC